MVIVEAVDVRELVGSIREWCNWWLLFYFPIVSVEAGDYGYVIDSDDENSDEEESWEMDNIQAEHFDNLYIMYGHFNLLLKLRHTFVCNRKSCS